MKNIRIARGIAVLMVIASFIEGKPTTYQGLGLVAIAILLREDK